MNRRELLTALAAAPVMAAVPMPVLSMVPASVTHVAARTGNIMLTPAMIHEEALRIWRQCVEAESMTVHTRIPTAGDTIKLPRKPS